MQKETKSRQRDLLGARGAPKQAFALRALARQLAGAPNGFGLFACAFLGRLLVMSAHLHFAEHAFALEFFLQDAEGLVNIIVAYENLHVDPNFL
jgi:hypothetical protein